MTLMLAAKTVMVHMSVLATEDTKEMDALARVSIKDRYVNEIRIRKDLHIINI